MFEDKVWQGEKTNKLKGFDNPVLGGDEIMSKNIIDVIKGIIIIINTQRSTYRLVRLSPRKYRGEGC